MSPGSIMPNYQWLFDNALDTAITPAKIRAMQKLGVPYPAGYDQVANRDLMKQSDAIVAGLAKDNIKVKSDKEIIAVIAYLQRMGTDIKLQQKTAANN